MCLRNSAKETNWSQRALNLQCWENAEHCNWPNVAPVRDAISLGLQSSGQDFNFSHPADDRQIFLTSTVMCNPQNVSSSLSNTHWKSLPAHPWRWNSRQGHVSKSGPGALSFIEKLASWTALVPGPCSLSQAGCPVVTQEGMSLMSPGHARELLSTCQQVTSYDNQTRANLRTLCVTAYLDLGLSFQSLSFTFAWAYSQPPRAPPVCPASACKWREQFFQKPELGSPLGRTLPGISGLSSVYSPRSGQCCFSICPISYQQASNIGNECLLLLLRHLIAIPSIVMVFDAPYQ